MSYSQKKQRLARYTVYVLFSLLFFACKLDPPLYPEMVAINVDSYQPIVPHAQWIYTVQFLTSSGKRVVTASNTSISIEGISYYEFTSQREQEEPQKEYFAKSQEMYLRRAYPEGFNEYAVFYYLKEDAVEGETWTYPINETGMISGTVAQTVTRMIKHFPTFPLNGKTYEDVVQTEVILEFKNDDGTWEQKASYTYYTARKVGIIQMFTDFLGYPSFTTLNNYES